MDKDYSWRKSFSFFAAKPVLSSLTLLLLFYFNQSSIHAWFLGQDIREVTIQEKINPVSRDQGSDKILEYVVTNTGYKAIPVTVKAKHRSDKVRLDNYDFFSIHANVASDTRPSITHSKNFSNVSRISFDSLPPGLGIRIGYKADDVSRDYWSGLEVVGSFGEKSVTEYREVSPMEE